MAPAAVLLVSSTSGGTAYLGPGADPPAPVPGKTGQESSFGGFAARDTN